MVCFVFYHRVLLLLLRPFGSLETAVQQQHIRIYNTMPVFFRSCYSFLFFSPLALYPSALFFPFSRTVVWVYAKCAVAQSNLLNIAYVCIWVNLAARRKVKNKRRIESNAELELFGFHIKSLCHREDFQE